MKDFIKKHNKLFLPYIQDKFNVTGEELSQVICEMWDTFKSPHMIENLLIKDHELQCKYYEICDTKYQRGKTIEDRYLESYSHSNNRSDQHISVFRHDSKWLANYKRNGSVSCSNTSVSPEWIYLELDRQGFAHSLKDGIRIYKNFPHKDRMILWTSGNRSIHIAVHASLFGNPIGKQESVCGIGKLFYNIAHKIVGDVRHGNGEPDPWLLNESETLELYYKTTGKAHNKADISKLKQELENIDPNLYRVNSLIRQPWSLHEKTGQPKQLIDPLTGQTKDKIKFDFDDKKPYLIHWVPEHYESKYETKPIIEIDVDDSMIDKVFNSIDGYDPSQADKNGWINNLYSPFYEDENPSVAVNIKSGFYKDFGEPTHTFGLVEFYSKLKGIDYGEARKAIKG